VSEEQGGGTGRRDPDGIPRDQKEKLFELVFQDQSVRKGFGPRKRLGLADEQPIMIYF
jgi:hypothetical protein